jgi:hypothetical protein
MQAINPIYVVAIIFLLSLTGAYVLFKFLKSYARIQRKDYQAGGALAGFLLIYAALYSSFDRIEQARITEARSAREAAQSAQSWTIEGRAMRSDTTVHDGIVVTYQPPEPMAVSDKGGNFRLDHIPLKKGDPLPELKFESESYFPMPLVLDPVNSVTDSSRMTIKLKDTIKLDRVR